LSHISGKVGTSRDVGVDGIGRGLALLLRDNGLLFEKRSEEFVGVLKRAERQYSSRIDLVQDGDFSVEIGVRRQRILFKVRNLRLDILGVPTD
jgi:hypothetical protein